MGWLKKLTKSKFGKAMDTFSAVFSNPLKSIKAATSKELTIKQVTKEHFDKPLSSQIAKTVLATGGYVAALYGGAAIATAAKAGTLKAGLAAGAKTLIPKTIKGKLIGGAAVAIGTGALVREPTKTISAAASLPGELAQFGGDVASFASDPSLSTAKQIIKESPIISGVLATAGLVGGGVAVANIASGIATRKEMKKQTAALENLGAATPTTQFIKEKPVGIQGETALTPATQTITTGKKRYKRRRVKKTPSVRTSVKINLINRPMATGMRILNKRYINERVLN